MRKLFSTFTFGVAVLLFLTSTNVVDISPAVGEDKHITHKKDASTGLLSLTSEEKIKILASKSCARNQVFNISDDGIKLLIGRANREFHSATGTVNVLSNGPYRLDFQHDGNLVLYGGNTPLWASGRKNAKTGHAHAIFNYNQTGEIVLRNWPDIGYWASSMFWGDPSFMVELIYVLQDDGNFVVYLGYDYHIVTGEIVINGNPIGATMTQNGQVSNRSGRLH